MNTVLIDVKKTGSDNLATIRGWSIRASCTSCPVMAAMRAAEKLVLRLGDDISFELKPFLQTERFDKFTCILSKKERVHAHD
jgi:hypothetical protein